MAAYESRHAAPRRRRRRRLNKKKVAVMALCALLLLAGIVWGIVSLVRHFRTVDTPGAQVEVPDWVTQDLLTVNAYSRPGTPLEEVNGVVIHYVGNPNTSAEANRSYFQNLALTHETSASAHFVVGLDGEIIQCVPLSEISYCSNKRNEDTIAIEVCHPDETGEFTPETLAAVEKLTAWLCYSFQLTEEDVIRHYDVNGKICPKYYVEHPEAWTDLLAGVRTALESYQAGGEGDSPAA